MSGFFHFNWLPNGLSLIRLVLGLGFPWMPYEWRIAAVAAAIVTDFLDGLSARWLRCESHVGLVLDPLADKVFVLMLAGTMIVEGTLSPWWALAVGARDLAVMVGIGVLVLKERPDFKKMKPSWLGKCATAAQFALLAVLVVEGEAWTWLLALTATLSVVAGVAYVWTFVHRNDASANRR